MTEIYRGLNQNFIVKIKNSNIFTLYLNNKDELFLGIRNNYVNLYYNGASICKIAPSRNGISLTIAKKYLNGITLSQASNGLNDNSESGYMKITEADLINNYDDICKNAATLSSKEKTAQHKLCMNNNSNAKAKYYCIDLEYIRQRYSSNQKNSGRFDIIAISKDAPHKVALIELKFGAGAIGGSSGVLKHARDFIAFTSPNPNSSLFSNHLMPEIVEIISSYEALGINLPFHNLSINSLNKEPTFYFITLGNGGGIARNQMRKYVLKGKGHSTINCETKIGYDISKPNSQFHAEFLFSDDDGTEIKDILFDNNYSMKGL